MASADQRGTFVAGMRYIVDHFEGDKEDFVLDPLTDWEPVERPEYWSDVVPTASSSHNTGCLVCTLAVNKLMLNDAKSELFVVVRSGKRQPSKF